MLGESEVSLGPSRAQYDCLDASLPLSMTGEGAFSWHAIENGLLPCHAGRERSIHVCHAARLV